MKLSKKDCKNLIDALFAYEAFTGCPKELKDDEVGLNAERFDDMIKRLINYGYPVGCFLGDKDES